ncbi:fungal-specific transcription factor domain-containing protein [Trichoderma velutinum]
MLHTQRPVKLRKRASKACLSCRARKVRCDVSRRGRPCMNCHLDGEACIVTGRARVKYRTTEHDSTSSPQKYSLPLLNRQPAASSTDEFNLASTSESKRKNRTEPTFAKCVNSLFAESAEPEPSPIKISVFDSQEDDASSALNHHLFSSRFQWAANRLPATNSDVVYSHYPFLSAPNIHTIPHEDLNFLEQQGCLRVPIRPILDEFIQQYFLHVHPFLPLLDEGDFWEMYDITEHPQTCISLLLFQAMLFASCTFMSQSTVCMLGFPNIRAMRVVLLRRTKLLYNLEIEASPLILSQAALLLTFTSISASKTPNTSWLGLAIENARLADAHLYSTMSPLPEKERNTLKRVWWCCIIRDRSIGLFLRRPLQVAYDHFDFKADPLNAADLSDEFNRSNVYNHPTKRYLADILTQWIKLYILMTDILLLVCPFKGAYNWVYADNRKNYSRLCGCKVALGRWYSSTSSKFPMTKASARDTIRSNDKMINIDSDTTTLYTNFMYMYYHNSRIVLCHYEMLLGFLQESNRENHPHVIYRQIPTHTQTELEQAISSIVECHNELRNLGLTRWLPIPAIGCIIFPLTLSVLNAKLSTRKDDSAHGADASTRNQLTTLIKVMQTYWAQYDGLDWIFEIVRHIVATVQFDISKIKNIGSSINWSDFFASRPASYVRLAFVLDFCLSKGRLPRDRDFPGNIRDVATNAIRLLENPVEKLCANQTDFAKNTTYASNTPQELPTTHPTNSISPSKIENYPFGLDESFVGNLEEQIHLHMAHGFPDNGMSQFMDVLHARRIIHH